MSPTLTAPNPAVFPAEVLAFAAERGVTEYLGPLYELAKQCFPGANVTVTFESDYEIPNLSWIVFEVVISETDERPSRAAYYHFTDEKIRMLPPWACEPFALRV